MVGPAKLPDVGPVKAVGPVNILGPVKMPPGGARAQFGQPVGNRGCQQRALEETRSEKACQQRAQNLTMMTFQWAAFRPAGFGASWIWII